MLLKCCYPSLGFLWVLAVSSAAGMVAQGLGVADADGDGVQGVPVWNVGVEAESVGIGVQDVGNAGQADGAIDGVSRVLQYTARLDAGGRRRVLVRG